MDEFFQSDPADFWLVEDYFPVNRSAFVGYESRKSEGGAGGGSQLLRPNRQNANKRMIEFWRRRARAAAPVQAEGGESERERCRRHMISERMRREKEKQGFIALHSMLPPGTKRDKRSIVEAAATEVEELQRCKEELERRKEEMERKLLLARTEQPREMEGAKIRIRVGNPFSGTDSMVEVLKCLRNMGTKTRAIQSQFSPQELSAVLHIESEMEAAEVEKKVQETFREAERKFRFSCPPDTSKSYSEEHITHGWAS
ncbi:transcription factor bHLH92 [Diospyros lotus]|uniref:transcription factor bHLH92 n=1 Tax=Diospyros lotus TaxID=55363 RepID=UPI00225AB19B|nr:transcription factor bHLH92 [Diospyros lotus]